MKLRILACAFACCPSGASKWQRGGESVLGWNLVKQLSRFHEVWVLTSSQNRSCIEAELGREPLLGATFCYVSLPMWLERLQSVQRGVQLHAYLWQLKAYFVARGLHRRFHFALFHHVTYANDWMASFIGALLPVLYLRGPGGGAHRTPKGFLSEYSFGGRLAERIRTVGQWIFRLDPFFQLGQRRAKAILVCNHEALEAVPRTSRSKAQLFPVNGISAADLSFPASARSLENKFRVLSAGKLLCIKGFSLAIRAFKLFVDRCSTNGTGEEAEFTIIGDGPELPRLRALIDRLGLQARVHFQDWMPRDKLLAAVAACDVFLFPSLRDGGGAVVVEAMAAGKPIICLDIAGPRMHVTNECGIKIPAQSPEQAVKEMALALDLLYTKQPLRLRMGTNARRRAEELYDWDRLGDRLLEIYKDVLRIKPVEV